MYNGLSILAVITARAGSKGIPMKNVRMLLGKPLFMWSVLAALKSKYVDYVVLSSNCEKCENIFIDFIKQLDETNKDRLIFIQRPEAYATDTSKNEMALLHAYDLCVNGYGLKCDTVINLQPTSPCRLHNLLDKTIEMYYKEDYNSLLTATRETPFLWKKNGEQWKYIHEDDCCNRKMRQQFREDEFVFKDNGSIYITDKNVLLETECRIGSNPCIYETDGLNCLQIDTEFDFQFIENMVKSYGLDGLI